MTKGTNKFAQFLDNEPTGKKATTVKKRETVKQKAGSLSTSGTKSVRINSDNYAELIELKNKTGVPLLHLLDQAVASFIEQEKRND
ncbi:hypothetical protein [Fructobacillus evanidus]|uniref:Predicted DNA-binding protein ribbon-helix-helix domain-containing protein n=1 Tax=Fructobacillus evanidus TaxID=3064281 RepID=A0ABM9MX43_9LACO|nr:unnamed protein product [Fructobacillus sp. LMG 32999]CAK1246452.1 unnamed protein product [Fructobacillus sp. LMG 32999]